MNWMRVCCFITGIILQTSMPHRHIGHVTMSELPSAEQEVNRARMQTVGRNEKMNGPLWHRISTYDDVVLQKAELDYVQRYIKTYDDVMHHVSRDTAAIFADLDRKERVSSVFSAQRKPTSMDKSMQEIESRNRIPSLHGLARSWLTHAPTINREKIKQIGNISSDASLLAGLVRNNGQPIGRLSDVKGEYPPDKSKLQRRNQYGEDGAAENQDLHDRSYQIEAGNEIEADLIANNGTLETSDEKLTLKRHHTSTVQHLSPIDHPTSMSNNDSDSQGWLNLFQDYNNKLSTHPTFPDMIWLREDKLTYFFGRGGTSCLIAGTWELSTISHPHSQLKCVCKEGWHGSACSIPDSVKYSEAGQYINLMKPRRSPRRIINAVAFNVEFELLEARIHELGDTVDVFIIHESNYTNYGTPKPLHLLQRLREGYLRHVQHKLMYMYRGDFPSNGHKNGWEVDESQRTYISKVALKRLQNLRSDDIFMYNDADEIPSHDATLFLKLHDGYPEPIGFSLRWSVFGFYWKQIDSTHVLAASSIHALKTLFQDDVFKIRSHRYDLEYLNSTRIRNFVDSGGFLHDWFIGEDGGFAGWHCSWCLPPEGIRIKLKSAINADFPRWGDFPEKLNLTYIRKLITTGMWFDDQTLFSMSTPKGDSHYAPRCMFRLYTKYRHLLDPDYYTN